MTTYDWPSHWNVNAFEMRVMPNVRAFPNAFNPGVQVVDLLGERWSVMLDLTPVRSVAEGAEREAYFDRLRGPINRIALYNLRFPSPRGTLRNGTVANVVNASLAAVTVVNASLQVVTVIAGQPALATSIAQFATTATINHIAGRTLKAGDMVGIGGQLVRVMTDAVADGAGQIAIEFYPRMRAAVAANTAVEWDRPTATFMLKADGVPTRWVPGFADAASLELIETF